jgi:hypothetical protein
LAAERDAYRIVRAIRELFEGRRNTTGTLTLTASATSTLVKHLNFGIDSVPRLMPATPNAATELGNGTIYVSARANGSFTLTHANNAQTDRIFLFSFDG